MKPSSVISFLDLNLSPHPHTAPAFISPKIEPKLEPVDPPIAFLDFSNGSAASAISSSKSGEVCSEFHRLSDLFQSNMAHKYGDASEKTGPKPNSRAIVPVPNPEVSVVAAAPPRVVKGQGRSSELVRVTDLKPDENSYFRELIRKTRVLFDLMRVLSIAEDERKVDAMAIMKMPSTARLIRGEIKTDSQIFKKLADDFKKELIFWDELSRIRGGFFIGNISGDVILFGVDELIYIFHSNLHDARRENCVFCRTN